MRNFLALSLILCLLSLNLAASELDPRKEEATLTLVKAREITRAYVAYLEGWTHYLENGSWPGEHTDNEIETPKERLSAYYAALYKRKGDAHRHQALNKSFSPEQLSNQLIFRIVGLRADLARDKELLKIIDAALSLPLPNLHQTTLDGIALFCQARIAVEEINGSNEIGFSNQLSEKFFYHHLLTCSEPATSVYFAVMSRMFIWNAPELAHLPRVDGAINYLLSCQGFCMGENTAKKCSGFIKHVVKKSNRGHEEINLANRMGEYWTIFDRLGEILFAAEGQFQNRILKNDSAEAISSPKVFLATIRDFNKILLNLELSENDLRFMLGAKEKAQGFCQEIDELNSTKKTCEPPRKPETIARHLSSSQDFSRELSSETTQPEVVTSVEKNLQETEENQEVETSELTIVSTSSSTPEELKTLRRENERAALVNGSSPLDHLEVLKTLGRLFKDNLKILSRQNNSVALTLTNPHSGQYGCAFYDFPHGAQIKKSWPAWRYQIKNLLVNAGYGEN